jgi:hypothetical protein
MGKRPAEPKRLSVWAVTKYACLGVPISVKYLDGPWREVLTPRFPLFFSVLGLLLVAMAGFMLGLLRFEEMDTGDIAAYGFYCFAGLHIWYLVPIVVNLFLLGCYLLILRSCKKKNNDIQVVHGAQRVLYFSAFFQALFVALAWLLLGWQAYEHISGFMSGLRAMLWVVVIIACVGRLMAVFQGMRRETGGDFLAALSSLLLSIDVWFFVSGVTVMGGLIF